MTAKSSWLAPGAPPPGASTRVAIPISGKLSHFPLAKKAAVPSLPVPCQESEEKQKHGKPLPSVSKSLGQGRSFVGNKGLATCCKARTVSASVVLGSLLWSPPLTSETSERIFLFPGNWKSQQRIIVPSADRTAFTQPDPARETRTVETGEGNEINGLFQLK